MVPATFKKHLVTIAANMTKRKMLKEKQRGRACTQYITEMEGLLW